MTNQELFDRIAVHLLTQRERSAREDGQCLYRTSTGLKCAIGCLIPDADYRESFENDCVSENPELRAAAGLTDADSLQLDVVDDLREIHDAHDPEEWYTELHELATDYSLNPAILETLK